MTREIRIRLVLFAMTLASVFWGYRILFLNHAPGVFRSPEEDLGYGWYVPLFSLYVLWTERRRILTSFGEPSLGGFLLLVPAFFLGFLGVRGTQVRLEIAGFSLMMISLAWMFFGRRTAARVTFPALFLFFCMPFTTYLDTVTVYLRLFGTSVSAGILECLGADIVRSGTMIAAADGSFAIDVAAPCSGLRSLFALMALTAGFAYFNQPTLGRRVLLFVFSVPLAIIGNVARILSIAFVGTFFSGDFALGFYHDYSGYVVFMTAIALMLGVSALITKGAEKCAR